MAPDDEARARVRRWLTLGSESAFLSGGYGPDDPCESPYCFSDVGDWSIDPWYRNPQGEWSSWSNSRTPESVDAWRWSIVGEDDYTFFIDGSHGEFPPVPEEVVDAELELAEPIG